MGKAIAFYAGACIPFHARSLDERPLGGTETAVIRLSEILALRGHEVHVFTREENFPPSPVHYHNISRFSDLQQIEVLVGVQDWRTIFSGVRRRATLFWTGDSFDQYLNFGVGDPRSAERIDRFLAVSDWHAGSFSERSGFPIGKMRVIRNGVYVPYFAGTEARERKRLIITPAPYRGLALLPPLFREIRKLHPEAELHVLSDLQIYEGKNPEGSPEHQQFAELRALLEREPGVVIHGNLVQQKLARELMRSSVFVYPNTFLETSCISALEALAAGCPVVTSAQGALTETVGTAGVCVPGEPGTAKYNQAFVQAVHQLLSDDKIWAEKSNAGRKRILEHYTWEHVASRFEKVMAEVLK